MQNFTDLGPAGMRPPQHRLCYDDRREARRQGAAAPAAGQAGRAAVRADPLGSRQLTFELARAQH